MIKRSTKIFRSFIIGLMVLTILTIGISMGESTPSINITGNDNYNVWGTVQNLEHSLHYVILVTYAGNVIIILIMELSQLLHLRHIL